MPKGSDNPFPSVLLVEGTVPSSPAAGRQRVYVDTADNKVKRVNSSGAIRVVEGGPASVSVLTSGTAATYTVPTGVSKLWVRMIGGGGGGGGADGDTAQAGAGAGGAGGGYLEKTYQTTPGATFTYTIGAGGTGGAAGNNAGASGGNTLFDEAGTVLTASGGGGGSSMASGTTATQAGGTTGGTGTNGDINISGQIGGRAYRWSGTQAMGGDGSSSQFGGGGRPGFNSNGQAAVGYGAGGGGGLSLNSTTDRAGGNGGAGVIVVLEFT